MTKTSTFAAILLVAAALGGASTEANAWSKQFSGTRAQVANACKGDGKVFLNDPASGSAACINTKNGTSVSCSDSGLCVGTGPGPMPRQTAGGVVPDMLGGGVMAGTAEHSGGGAESGNGTTGQWSASPPSEPRTGVSQPL